MDSIHPEAARNFEERGEALVQQISAGDLSGTTREAFPAPFVSGQLSEEDIKSFEHFSKTDESGREKARFFEVNGKIVGLQGKDFTAFESLCESVHNTSALNRVLALRTCKKLVFEWLARKYRGDDGSLCGFVEQRRDELVASHQIVIPVHELLLQSEAALGRVMLRPLTSEAIDAWLEQLVAKNPEMTRHLPTLSEKIRKSFQGRAASWVSVEAEERRAFEIAQADTRKALAVLRLFSRAAFMPSVASYCVPWGEQHVVREYHFTIRDGAFSGFQESLVAPLGTLWRLPRADFEHCWANGLQELSTLISLDRPSDYEKVLIQAVQVYSRATLTADPSDKLLHIFTALESLLLKNQNEPVTSAISERMAFLAGQSADERLTIASLVKAVYGFRSRYVHHALPVADHQRVRRFLLHAWDVLMGLVRARRTYAEKAEMHAALERRKFI